MSGPFGSSQWMYNPSTSFYPHSIDQSLRFEDGDSPQLTRTPSSSSNRTTWTWSAWIKRGNLSYSSANMFSAYSGANDFEYIRFDSDDCIRYIYFIGGSVQNHLKTSGSFRDTSAWYHILVQRSGSSSEIYVNGVQQDLQTETRASTNGYFNHTVAHNIGRFGGTGQHFDGYIAEMHFVDGTSLNPTSFGETKAGIWIPKEYSGSYGTNGFHLTFKESGDLGTDSAYTTHDIFGDSSAVATYLFDGSIVDAGGNYNGTTTSVTFTDGIVGTQAGVFNGTSSKWVAGTHLLGSHATDIDISVSGWFQVSATYQYLVFDGNAGTGGGYFAIYSQGSGYLEAATGHASNGNSITVTGSEVITDGEWHHFAFTKSVSGGTATGKLWVDGNYAGSDTTTDSTAYSNETSFAYFAYSPVFYACVLDQIRIFNRVLTDAEIQELAGGYGLDASGVGNHFNPANLQSTDVVLDSPTNNWCVLNSLNKQSVMTLSEGNLKTGGGNGTGGSTFEVSSGKWYWEVRLTEPYASVYWGTHGVNNVITDAGVYSGGAGFYALNSSGGGLYANGSLVTAKTSGWATGDIIGLAYDADSGTLDVYQNNSQLGSSLTVPDASNFPVYFQNASGGDTSSSIYNFGQDGSFAGTETAQGNADGNGIGDFFYSPPSGFLALCTANLPDPAIDPAQDEEPADYFNTVLYTGNGTSQSISSLSFQPNWVWIKERSGTPSHAIFDSVRGATKRIKSDSTDAELTQSTGLTSFDSNGFSLGSNTAVNASSDTYVAWNWLAGGSAVSNSNGSITSSVSANTKAGFSIITYTGTGSNATVGHGLNSTPEFLIIKGRDTSYNWVVWVDGFSTTQRLLLDTTGATSTGNWNTLPTSSVFGLGSHLNINNSGSEFVCYAFHSVDGYSKVGSYTGNGSSSDGVFVQTGFRPALILLKTTTATGQNWIVFDNKRLGYNGANRYLLPSAANAESTNDLLHIFSNGFQPRTNGNGFNGNGQTYIYLAFADQPAKYSNAR